MFQQKLLEWYALNHRPLPWRETHEPYRIWLSEIMLQQTQVITVIKYFNRFIDRYPNVEALAEAVEDDVLKLWEGLGYYSRARRLIPCARMVVSEYDGVFPKTYKEIIRLPGVGSYTAGAILSIAYNVKVAAVDGNVMRVYSRLYDLDWDISLGKTKKRFEEKVHKTLPEDRRHFNQALMELGATICTPKKPNCERCPIQSRCLAFSKGHENQLPIKTKKIKKKHLNMAVLYITYGDEILLIKRPGEGLLGGLWGFMVFELTDELEADIKYNLINELGLEFDHHELIKTGKHIFTHLVWDMKFFNVCVKEKVEIAYPESVWVTEKEIENYALPTAFKKLI